MCRLLTSWRSHSGPTSDIIDTEDTDDIGSQLQDLGYDRTFLFYHSQAASVPVTAAPLGLQLPKKPGSSQWAYKRLKGVSVSELSVADRSAAIAKNVNIYGDRANTGVFEPGKMVSGEWIDTIVVIDALQADIQNRVWGQFINNEKIPYTDDGVNVIVNALEAALAQSVRDGTLAANPPPYVTRPLVQDVSPTDKGNRILPDVKFFGTLAGAITKTVMVGRLVL